MEQRLFSVDEANELLPVLRPILRDLKREWDFMQAISSEVRKAYEASERGGGSAVGPSYVESAGHVVHYLHRIEQLGVLLKDPGTGLCDFPHQRGDRIIYLCWRLGENEIAWWHDTDSGFAGREPLEDLDG